MSYIFSLGMLAAIFLVVTIILRSTTSGATSRWGLFEAAATETHMHEQWMARFHRVYSSGSEKKRTRFDIFKKNWEFVESFNMNKNTTYKLDVNEFSDLTDEEFRATYTGLVVPKGITGVSTSDSEKAVPFFRYGSIGDAGESMDWRDEGAVTPIKHQGRCVAPKEGNKKDESHSEETMEPSPDQPEDDWTRLLVGACWAFSTVAAVEGLIKIMTGELLTLSEQQLVDCNTKSNGCGGGDMTKAFEYITENGGITATEQKYSYQGSQQTCLSTTQPADFAAAMVSGYERVPANNEQALLKAVSQQPVSVAIDVTEYAFRHYTSGIYDGDCGTQLNHAVTIVGYGVSDEGTKYWVVKNSWGKSWGEDGYMRIKRDVDAPQGMCGLAMFAYYPLG